MNDKRPLPSILALYFQNFGVVFVVLVVLSATLLLTVRHQMRPYFLSKIEERVRDEFRNRSTQLSHSLIQDDLKEATLIIKSDEFIPEASSKKIIPPTSDLIWTCEGERHSFSSPPLGDMCQMDSSLSFNFPLKVGDNRLGRIEIVVPASISSWLPYQQLERGVIASVIFLLTLGAVLAFRFRKRVAIPMEETMEALDRASDNDDFEPILKKLPFREIFNVMSRLAARSSELSKAKQKARLGEMASQVYHDIQSPLQVLIGIAEGPDELSSEKRKLIISSARRMGAMTHDLLGEHLEKQDGNFFTFLSRPMTSIFQEKQLLLTSKPGIQLELKIPVETQSYAASISPCELSRVLSNLLNNSIEALEGRENGKITLSLQPVKDVSSFARIVIEDNGIGMAPELLEKMRQLPESFGKVNGHGLGLRHAQKVMHKIGTFVMIDSVLGVGTKIILAIPLLPKPVWFEDQLPMQANDRVVVLDDDECVHQLWKQRLGEIEAVYLKSADDFDIDLYPPEKYFYFFDYHLGKESPTGLDLIEKYHLKSRSLLVTGSFDEKDLQKKVEELGVKMMPKFLIQSSSNFECSKITQSDSISPDLILINDEDDVNEYWSMQAGSIGKRLLVVSDERELDLETVRPSTPIYIHKSLKGLRSGIDMARTLYSKGFVQLFLTTGDPHANLDQFPFLKGIVGKSFPIG